MTMLYSLESVTVPLHGKRDSAEGSKVTDSEPGRLFWIVQRSNLVMSPQRRRTYICSWKLLRQEEEETGEEEEGEGKRDCKWQRDLATAIDGFEHGWRAEPENAGNCWKLRTALSRQPTPELCQQPKRARKEIPPWVDRKEPGPADTLILAPGDQIWTSDLQNHKLYLRFFGSPYIHDILLQEQQETCPLLQRVAVEMSRV